MVAMASAPSQHRRLTRRQRRLRARLRGLAALCVLIAVVVLATVGVARLAGGSGADEAASGPGRASSGGASGGSSGGSADGPSASPSATAPPVRVVSGGDVMSDRGVKAYAQQYGADAVFSGVAPQLRAGDAAWVNLEGPISTVGTPTAGKDYTFEGSPAMAGALAGAGIDVVTVANNHAVDYGPSALLDTIKNLKAAGIKVAGGGRDFAAAHTPALIKTKAGATIAFLGYDDVIWPGYAATATQAGIAEAVTDMAQVKSDIRKAKKVADFVVVAFHWGFEYEHYPVAQQTSEGHAAIDAGADLVIGHHPHVLQGFEAYHGRLIAYSLGDFVFDHFSVETGQTVLVDAVLTAGGVKATLIPVYVSSSGIPAVQHGASAKTILSLVKEYSSPLDTHVAINGDTATVKAGRP
jgi:poly-gamma-glutamate capsule biosynthesis protein CapA/YwtB (metallophosphatase superfamily)